MNVMQMLVNNPSLSGDGGVSNVGEYNLLTEGQQFGHVLAQLVSPTQLIPPTIEEGEEALALQFQIQLEELLSTLGEVTADNEYLENTAGQNTSSDASSTEEGADEALIELMSYLEQFIHELEQNNLSDEEVYSLFVAIPQLPAVVTLAIEHDEVTLRGNGSLHSQGTQTETQHWTRWTMLLEQIHQVLQGKSLDQGTNQAKQDLISLVNNWKDQPEWLAILHQKIGREIGKIETVLAQSTTKPEQPVFSTYLPLSLLNQMNKDTGFDKQNQSNHVQSSPIVSNETPSTTSQISTVGNEVRELVQEGTDRLASQSKPSESTPLPSARMTHLLEDMQGVFRKQISLLKDGDATQLRVRLTPEHLGHLDIRITSENGKVIAQIMTSTKLAKEALEVQLHQLRATLVQQGIQIERMEVSQQTNSHNLLHQEHRGAQHFQQQKGQKGAEKQADYTEVDELENIEGVFYDRESQVNYAV